MKNKKLLIGVASGIAGATAALFGIKKIVDNRKETLVTEDELFEEDKCECGEEAPEEACECACQQGCCGSVGFIDPTDNIADLAELDGLVSDEVLAEINKELMEETEEDKE